MHQKLGPDASYDIKNASLLLKMPYPLPDDYNIPSIEWDDPRTVGLAPGAFIHHDSIEKAYTPPSPEERYYAFGRIKYFDTFRRKERTTTYCFAVDIKDFITKSRNAYIATQKTHFESPVIFDFAPQHNDAD